MFFYEIKLNGCEKYKLIIFHLEAPESCATPSGKNLYTGPIYGSVADLRIFTLLNLSGPFFFFLWGMSKINLIWKQLFGKKNNSKALCQFKPFEF